MLHFLAFVMIQAAAPGASADPPVALSPKPKWVVFYADNYCVLIRPRSGSAGGMRIESRPFEAEHELQFLLPTAGETNEAKLGRLSVPSARRATTYLTIQEFRSSRDRWVRTAISTEQLLQAAKDKSLGVTVPGMIEARVTTAGLAKALAALKTCEQALAIRWGTPRSWAVDPVPQVDPLTVFRDEDYPTSMLNANVKGDARLLVKIGASGEALACRSINPGDLKQCAEIVCAVIRKRVRFAPAREPAGQAVESYYVTPRVRFRLAG